MKDKNGNYKPIIIDNSFNEIDIRIYENICTYFDSYNTALKIANKYEKYYLKVGKIKL
jgi:hypothetical protein